MHFLYESHPYLLFFGDHLNAWIAKYGIMVYAIMFAIIFCETGLVIAPFLPGDSMIFAAAALSAQPHSVLDVHLIALFMTLAAFAGDVLNYSIGRYIGPKAYRKNYKLISKKRIDQTRAFFKEHGVHTIIYARFIPFIRTFAPFLAGVSLMPYPRFMKFNFIGGLSWVLLFAYGGYFFGNLPFVKEHLRLTLLITFVVTLVPAIYSIVKS
ncbi:MAG: VTT domain-containing protein, partial [Flavisolibacter sp.]